MSWATKRNVLCILAVIVTALGFWYVARAHRASAAGGLPPLVEQAPADATMIAYVDLSALRASPWIQQLEALAQPAQVDADYTAFIAATGFDYQKDLDRVAIYSSAAQVGSTLVIAEGRFDQNRIEQYALRSGKLQQQNGQGVYVVPSATGKNVSLAFLAGNRIALSDGGSLGTLLASNSHPGLDAPMRERLSRVSGAPVFAVVKTSTLTSANASSPGAPAKAGVLGRLQSMQWIALALQPGGTELLLSAEGECATPEDAQQVAGTLELLRSLFRGTLNDPKSRGGVPAQSAAAMGKLLDGAKINAEAARVRLLVSVTPDMLQFARPTNPAAR